MSAAAIAIDARLEQGAVIGSVQNMCPVGTKAWMLCLGYLECDDAFVVRGGNTSTMSTRDKSFVNKRRVLPMYCVLIEHPHDGLILWETGSGKDYPEVWGPQLADIFSRTQYEPHHELRLPPPDTRKSMFQERDRGKSDAFHRYKDVKMIIIGHLHLDHAGGLDLFKDMKDIPIWVHERELKSAFYSVATGADAGVYLDHYLDTSLNWKTFDDTTLDFAQGEAQHPVVLDLAETAPLQELCFTTSQDTRTALWPCSSMLEQGTFLFTGDLFHVAENYSVGIPQGWLARDHPAWFNSYNRIKRLAARTKGKVIMGHDLDVCNEVWAIQKNGPLM